MQASTSFALKEWAVSCSALLSGEQLLLIRKGGIREEDGRFSVAASRFLMLPTHEHQDAALLQPRYAERLVVTAEPDVARLEAFAEVDETLQVESEEPVNAASEEHIWNPLFVKQRFDYNPYSPLCLLILRAYRIANPIEIPMRPAYLGCKSWIALEHPVEFDAAPVLTDREFQLRKTRLLDRLKVACA